MDGDAVCECGDVFDEHDGDGVCTVPGCPCFYFDAAGSTTPEENTDG
jgi:hypothetical protein